MLRRFSEALEGQGRARLRGPLCPRLYPRLPGLPGLPAAAGGGAFDEARLLHRVRERDEAAPRRPLRPLRRPGLRRRLRTGDRHLAEEVLQDTLFRCWDEVARFDPARGASPAGPGVARNRAIDPPAQPPGPPARAGVPRSRRPSRPWLRDGSAPPVLTGGPHSPGEDLVLLRETVTQALDGLPLAQRQAISPAYYGGLNQSRIATLLWIPWGRSRPASGTAWSASGALRPPLDPDLPDAWPTPGPRVPQAPPASPPQRRAGR